MKYKINMKKLIITTLLILSTLSIYSQKNMVIKPNSMLISKEFIGKGFNSVQFKYDKKSGTPANLSILIIDEEDDIIKFYNKTEFYKGGINKLSFPTKNDKKYIVIFEYRVEPSGTTLYDTLFITKFKLK
jgi:hypothetical protein